MTAMTAATKVIGKYWVALSGTGAGFLGVFAWIAGGTAISRASILIGSLAASALMPVSEYGRLGVALSISVIATQAIGYSGAMFFLKSARLVALGNISKLLRIVAIIGGGASAVYFVSYGLVSSDREMLFAGTLFVMFNCTTQCLVAATQSHGFYKQAAQNAGLPLIAGSLLAVILSWKLGPAGFMVGVSTGYLLSSLLLIRFMVATQTTDSNTTGGRKHNAGSDVLAIGMSGLAWGVVGAWIIGDLQLKAGADAAGYYAFGVQIRSALFFIPGVVGVQLLSMLSRSSSESIDGEFRQVVKLSVLMALGVALLGIVIAVIGIGLADVLNLKALKADVMWACVAVGAVVAASTPLVRLVSIRCGEWYNFVITSFSALMTLGLCIVLPGDPFWRTLAFVGGYAAQLFLVCLILHLFVNSRKL